MLGGTPVIAINEIANPTLMKYLIHQGKFVVTGEKPIIVRYTIMLNR
jgi:hypothetical protein